MIPISIPFPMYRRVLRYGVHAGVPWLSYNPVSHQLYCCEKAGKKGYDVLGPETFHLFHQFLAMPDIMRRCRELEHSARVMDEAAVWN